MAASSLSRDGPFRGGSSVVGSARGEGEVVVEEDEGGISAKEGRNSRRIRRGREGR